MRNTTSMVLAGMLAINCTRTHADEVPAKLHGELGVEHAAGTRHGEAVLTRAEATLSARFQAEGCSAKIALRLRWDARLAPLHTKENELREAAFVCRFSDWLLGVGRQAVVWGKADNFRVLDAVHPFDYREFLLGDKEAARRPLAMVRIERQMGELDAAQLLLITERRADVLPGPGDRFSALFPQGALDRIATPGKVPPESTLANAQAGIKWEHTGRQLGYTVNMLNRWSPQATYTFNPQTGAVTRNAYRQTLLGGSFDLALSEWVVRGEAIYTPHVYLPTSSPVPGAPPEYQRNEQSVWVAGVDRSVGEWFLSAQLFESRVTGSVSEPLQGRKQRLVSVSATRSFLQDQLKVRAFVARDVSQGGTWVSVSAVDELSPGWELSAGVDVLNGVESSVFGKIKNESRVKVAIKLRL
ncbi:MAG: hypothetical protein JWP34_567 [Massilia sp.]|nr:hypothetical protein [Massilia sp.]